VEYYELKALKVALENLEKYINASSSKNIFCTGISKLDDKQKSELGDLVIRLDKAGAKNPLQWAFSEVAELFKICLLSRIKPLFKVAKGFFYQV
jgi:hypothetical protein